MTKILSIVILIAFSFTTYAQVDITQYLKTHHYYFTLDKGFDQQTTDTLKKKLSAYKLILQAEGGSHDLNIYKKIPLIWVTFLNKYFGLTHVFLEFGHSAAVCANNFLVTNDTSNLYDSSSIEYWRQYSMLNSALPDERKVKFFGIDFNRSKSYFKALKKIIPNKQSPENIKSSIALIKSANDSLKDCSYLLDFNATLKQDLTINKPDYVTYLGERYKDFERIVMSKGTCNDVYKNRNYNIAGNFLSFDAESNDSIYYGELGMAHTILKNKVAATIINNSLKFKYKVCVINLYCYNCTTNKEQVSNWPLKKIEKDILQYFLPYCSSDFTLFDLSGNIELTKKYSDYGQYLIIAKNQN
jgi:hypothetical protein